MTGTEPSPSLPIRKVFFDSPGEAVAALSAASRDQVSGTLARMPEAARNTVLGRVDKAVAGLLELDITEIFQAAWTKADAVLRAAEETAAAPDTEQTVGLAEWNTSIPYEPSVEVQVKDVTVATITLQMRLDIDVHGLVAVLKCGRIIEVQAATSTIAGTLQVAGKEVMRRQVNVNLPLVIRLKRGITLVAATAPGC